MNITIDTERESNIKRKSITIEYYKRYKNILIDISITTLKESRKD